MPETKTYSYIVCVNFLRQPLHIRTGEFDIILIVLKLVSYFLFCSDLKFYEESEFDIFEAQEASRDPLMSHVTKNENVNYFIFHLRLVKAQQLTNFWPRPRRQVRP